MMVNTADPDGSSLEGPVHLSAGSDKSELHDRVPECEDQKSNTDDRHGISPRNTCEYPKAEDDESDEHRSREVRRHDGQHHYRRNDECAIEILPFVLLGVYACELVGDDDDETQFRQFGWLEGDACNAYPSCGTVDSDYQRVTGDHRGIDQQGADRQQDIPAEAYPISRYKLDKKRRNDSHHDEKHLLPDRSEGGMMHVHECRRRREKGDDSHTDQEQENHPKGAINCA